MLLVDLEEVVLWAVAAVELNDDDEEEEEEVVLWKKKEKMEESWDL